MQVNGEDLYKPPNLPFDVNQARTDVENAKKGAISCFGSENTELIELYDCSYETLRKEVSKLGLKSTPTKIKAWIRCSSYTYQDMVRWTT